MLHTGLIKRLDCYGPDTEVAYVRWSPSNAALQTLTEAHGVLRVERSGAGAYKIVFARRSKSIQPVGKEVIQANPTAYHVPNVESLDPAAGEALVTHKSVAFASVASGPSGSDTVDGLAFTFLLRMAS